MSNAGLDEVQAEIKIAGRNISDLRYADDTTLMAESEEELKSQYVPVFLPGAPPSLREKPGRLQSTGSQRVGNTEVTLSV